MSLTNEQQQHCESIVERFSSAFRAKYRKGQIEHGGNMWDKPGMIEHAIEEVLDLAAYLYTKQDQDKRSGDATLMPVIYVAGPFRGKDSWEMEQNIRRAEALALEAWRLGCAVICPHANTRFFQGAADDSVWLDGDLAMLARCDAILLTPDWERSKGATAERAFAIARGIPVLESVRDLQGWRDRRVGDLVVT